MTDTTPRAGRAPRLLARARTRLRAVTGAPARTWLHVLATMALVLGFVVWGVVLAFGAEAMYLISRYVGQEQADTMAYGSALLTLVGAGVLLARHARPVIVAAVVAALAAASLGVAGATNGYELAIGAALFAVAAAHDPRRTWTVAGAVVVTVLAAARVAPRVTLVGSLVAGDTPGDPDAVTRFALPGLLGEVVPPWWIVTALPVVVLALLGVAFGTLVRTARLRNAALAEAAAARAAEEEQRTRVLHADERARIAREMHDVIAHSVTVMIALGGGAAAALDRSPDQARRALDELVDTGRGALEDVRRILGVLHAPQDAEPVAPQDAEPVAPQDAVPMAPQPGVADLPRLVERFRTAGLPVRTGGLAVGGLDGLGDTVQLAVHRIVQESLTNALRHAPGTARVDVDVRRRPGVVEVVVTDQGPAGDVVPSPGTRRGVVGMSERAAAFGGTVEAGPYGHGWRVHALLPQPDPTPPAGARSAGAPSTEGEA